MERRRFLALCGGGAATLAGCLGFDEGDSPSSGTPTDMVSPTRTATSTASPTDSPSPTETATSGVLRLAPAETPADGTPLVVYPSNLQEWLREAASRDTTLRVNAGTYIENPTPVVPSFDRVRLQDSADEVTGWYAVDAEGGVRYRYKADAVEASPPDDATVTSVEDLAPDRRDLAVAAITGDTDGDDFSPETELGEWARTEFFGGHVRYNGTVYQGLEQQQTDAALFSDECWYILSLDAVSGSDGPSLALAGIDDETRAVVDGMLEDRNYPYEPSTRDGAAVPTTTVRFFETTDFLLTHASVLSVEAEDDEG